MKNRLKKLSGGLVHKTYFDGKHVIQFLNPKFPVPNKNTTNKLINVLRCHGILAADILYQDRSKRILEYLCGDFYEKFTEKQCLKAIKFVKRLHEALTEIKATSTFKPIHDFNPEGTDTIYGDVKASNIEWKKGEPVGIVDYDTISKGDKLYDVFFAILLWQKTFQMTVAKKILKEYGNIPPNVSDLFRKFILIKIKEISTQSLGLGYFIPKSKKYYQKRISELNDIYEKSLNWRSI